MGSATTSCQAVLFETAPSSDFPSGCFTRGAPRPASFLGPAPQRPPQACQQPTQGR